ncbi:MAG: hypothetical protein EPO26_13610 [Chloroflexota bacterium]|nr:MAG: hypothetical protein EPO26_13610 [Chloroflexota bacterium]
MRRLIISDIHGNIHALDAVLAATGRIDEIWCLGDVVDLGAWSEECVQRLREIRVHLVLGNHDLAVLDRPGPEFERIALLAESHRWTRDRLSAESLAYLRAAPERLMIGDARLIHDIATARDLHPAASESQSAKNHPRHGHLPTVSDRAAATAELTLVGHYHLPTRLTAEIGDTTDDAPNDNASGDQQSTSAGPVNVDSIARIVPDEDRPYALDERQIVNPGPIGVPDWRPSTAGYAIVEDGCLSFHSVEIDPVETLRVGIKRGAPPLVRALWQRQAADALVARGDLDAGRDLIEEAIEGTLASGSLRQTGHLLITLADRAEALGRLEIAATLIGAAIAEPNPAAIYPTQRYRAAIASRRLRDAMTADALERAITAGKLLDAHEAIAAELA